MGETATGGTLYYNNDSGMNTTRGTVPTWSTSSATITYGTSSCSISASVSSSAVGSTSTVLYYYTTSASGTNYKYFNPSSTGSFAVGTYYIWAVGCDQNIFVRSSSYATLKVNSAATCAPSWTDTTDSIYSDETLDVSATHVTTPSHSGTISYIVRKGSTTGTNIASTVLSATSGTSGITFTPNGTGTYYITATCSAYTSSAVTRTVTVTERTPVYLLGFGSSSSGYWTINDSHKMSYDTSNGYYYMDVTLDENTGYGVASRWDTNSNDTESGFKFYYNGTYYGNTGAVTPDSWSNMTLGTNWEFKDGVSNCGLTTGAGGTYRFIFQIVDSKYYAKIIYPDDVYYLVGTFNMSGSNWLASSDYQFTNNDDGTYSLTGVTFDASQSYGIKVCRNGNFDQATYGKSATVSATTTLSSLSYSTSSSQITFNTTYGGDFDFTFNPTALTLKIEYPTTVSIKFYNESTLYSTVTALKGKTLTPPSTNPTKTGHDFGGWAYSSTPTTAIDFTTETFSSDTNVYAIWTPSVYSIKLYTNGGSVSSYDETTENTLYTGSYTYGVGATLPTPTAPSGTSYSFGGWYTSSTFSGSAVTSISTTATGAKTYYAKWTVTVTFVDSVNMSNQIERVVTVNGSATVPTTDELADHSSEGFCAKSAVTYDGTYTNVTQNETVYIIYKPVAQSFTITLTPTTDVSGAGTSENPYVISFGSSIYAEASISQTYTGITYKWSTDNSTYEVCYDGATALTTSYKNQDITTKMTVDSSTLTLYAKAYFYYTVDGVQREVASDSPSSYTIYYTINTPLTGIEFIPPQKIYNTSATIQAQIQVNMQSAVDITDFMTTLYYFDKDTKTYTALSYSDGTTDYTRNDITAGVGTNEFISTFSTHLLGNLNNAGVKYYYAMLNRPVTSDGTTTYVDDSMTSSIHTTVGTSEDAAARPFFFSNNTGTSFANYRVMVFYLDSSSSLHYQSGRVFTRSTASDTEVFRFDLPSNVTEVTFGVFSNDVEYLLPTVADASTGSLAFTNGYYIAYSNAIDISSSVQSVKATALDATTKVITVESGMLV